MLILNSSDFRPRYIRDIAAAVAAPAGGQFQLRYQARYLSPEVLTLLGKESAQGAKVLVCFVGDRASDKPHIVPVRVGQIARIRKIGDAYVLTVTAGGYPDMNEWPLERRPLIKRGQEVLGRIVANSHGQYYAAYSDGVGLATTETSSTEAAWTGVVTRLLALPTFATSFFLRIDLADAKGESIRVAPDEAGWITLDPRRSYRIRTWFYGSEANFGDRSITLETDGEVLSSISDQIHRVRSRYDQLDFWFTPTVPRTSMRTLLRVLSSAADDADPADVPTEFEFPCLVKRPLAPRLGVAVLAGASATAVAAPALMADSTPIEVRVAIAGLGALGVAFAAALP